MSEIESIAVHIGLNRMTIGYYTIEDGELKMLGPEGEVIKTHKLQPGESAKALAGIFTKQIRESRVDPFWDDIELPRSGIA